MVTQFRKLGCRKSTKDERQRRSKWNTTVKNITPSPCWYVDTIFVFRYVRSIL